MNRPLSLGLSVLSIALSVLAVAVCAIVVALTPTHGRYTLHQRESGVLILLDSTTGETWMWLAQATNAERRWFPILPPPHKPPNP